MNNEKKRIEALLKLKTAPEGMIESNFAVALYVVAALYQFDFSSPSNLGMCSSLLGSVGYKGDLGKFSQEDYFNTLSDLEAKGSLVALPNGHSYATADDICTIKGKVRVIENNLVKGFEKIYSYVIDDEEGKEYTLNTDYVILPNDEVEAIITKSSNIAYVKRIVKVRQCVLGRLLPLGKKLVSLVPDEPTLKDLAFNYANPSDLGDAKSGDVVIAEIVKRINSTTFQVKTRQVVKDIGNLNNIIVMAVLRNDIPNVWPENLVRSLSRIPDAVDEKEAKGRVDLRNIPLVTIDGEDARDFDDAVYCKKEGSSYRLFVSIADVSTYVKPGTLLDKEAMNRCNSCYFPNFVIPMLPEKLSNGICSLNPDVDRLCMTCEMVIDKHGNIDNYRFYPAIMRSHARLTYNEAWQMISEGTARFEEHKAVIDDVKELYNLYELFKKNRINRGGISVESEELHFVFDENMEIQGVKPLERNDAHKLIEECMIAANVAAARFVSEHKAHTLYRVHAKPMEKKLSLLISQLARFGLSLPGKDEPSSKDFMNLSDLVAKREDGKLINELILRAMSKAEYTPENIGHFGLALEKYAHFTSPIRRYADLQLHRVIKYLLEHDAPYEWGKIGSRSYTKSELVALGAKCTQREIAAEVAEREVDSTLACIYMEKFIGEVVEGTVTAVASFGAFMRLEDFGVDGMIYIGNFDSYMNYSERDQTLVSQTGQVYAVGKKVKVVIAGVDQETRKIDLIPASSRFVSTKALKKERDALLEKRRKISQNAPKSDKEKLLKSLKDISQAREANPEDTILRPDFANASIGKELMDNTSPLGMNKIKVSKKNKKGKK